MVGVCARFGATLVAFNGEHDHVHLLVHYPPKLALSALLNSLKGVSARLLRTEYPAPIRTYLWSGPILVAVLLCRLLRGSAPVDHQRLH